MKKNAMLKIAAILMVAVLLTTCAISSTFAKYITTGEGDASARVAKWGVEVTVDADEAFYTNYHIGTNDIVVAGTTKVVAPGTQNKEAITITVSGTPEVDATIAATGNFLQLTNWNSTEGEYCPLIFNIGDDDEYYIGMDDIANVNELQTAVNNAISSALNEQFEANVEKTISITVGWTWNYVAPSAEDYPNFVQEDDQDSDLGDIAATNTANAPTVAFDATITVTQTGSNYAQNGAYVAPADPEGT